jgi:hypothetical protein
MLRTSELPCSLRSRNSLDLLGVATAAILCLLPNLAKAGGALDIPFDPANFSGNALVVDNPYWPLNPDGTTGRTFTYVAETEDGCAIEQATIVGLKVLTGGAAPYDNFGTVEVEDIGYIDAECTGNPADWIKTEHTFDRYRQDDNGNIWYLGELSLDYEAESDYATPCSDISISPSLADEGLRPDCYHGSWEAGMGPAGGSVAEAGIVVPSDDPKGTGEALAAGTYYMQELAEEAMDVAKVVKVDAKVKYKIDGQTVMFQHCRVTKEYSSLEHGAVEQKSYCPDDDGLVVIEELNGGATLLTVLDSIDPALP